MRALPFLQTARGKGATEGATPMEAGVNGGRFHVLNARNPFRIDTSGSRGRPSVQLRTRRSHVRVMPGAP